MHFSSYISPQGKTGIFFCFEEEKEVEKQQRSQGGGTDDFKPKRDNRKVKRIISFLTAKSEK